MVFFDLTRIKNLILAFAILTSAGCATTPASLPKATRQEAIILSDNISYIRPWMHRVEYGAFAGRYTAEREDAEGVYYFSNDRTVWERNEALYRDNVRIYTVGGIYVPKNPVSPPQLFYIDEREQHMTNDINAYLLDRKKASTNTPDSASALGVLMSSTTVPGASIGANAVGGAVAGGVVALAIEASIGDIAMTFPIKDPALAAKIRASIQADHPN